ncbi:MAG: iron transporter permease [Lachnospiraceae bacterium]|jgi:iron complex transport system permease protein|nr:iron transporter permease [Lachnospiraceae bacterium]
MIPLSIYKKQKLILFISLTLILATISIGMVLGYSPLSLDRLIMTLAGNGTMKEEFILFQIRLPRILITLLSGMALSLSGSILQGITRNDLTDPGIIGINSGAGVAITVFFLYVPIDTASFTYLLPVVAFAGAIITAMCIYFFSLQKNGGFQPERLLLVGVGFSAALSGTMIVLISSAERIKVDFIANWLSGNIWGTDWPFVLALLPWLVLLIPFTLYKARRINILQLGESVAIGVGISVEKERRQLLVAAVALAASAVSVTGGIAFIGLMAPHLAKALLGPRNQLYIPVSILLGGWLLLLADTIGRNIVSPEGIPAGVMVSFIGAPYFLYLLRKKLN